VIIYELTWYFIAEGSNLHIFHYKNLKPEFGFIVFIGTVLTAEIIV
jgi:hypothetical protein